MSEKKKEDIFTSPKGVAKFPHLSVPQTKFKPEGEYAIGLLLDPNDAATIELVEKITAAHAAGLAEAKKANPKLKLKDEGITNMLRDDINKDGEPTGKLEVRFKAKASGTRKDGTKWTWKPALYDVKGQPLPADVAIYGGSVVKVGYSIRHAAMKTGSFYTSLSLKAVQGINIVSAYTKDASSFGFGDESGEEGQDAFGEEAPAGESGAKASADF